MGGLGRGKDGACLPHDISKLLSHHDTFDDGHSPALMEFEASLSHDFSILPGLEVAPTLTTASANDTLSCLAILAIPLYGR